MYRVVVMVNAESIYLESFPPKGLYLSAGYIYMYKKTKQRSVLQQF